MYKSYTDKIIFIYIHVLCILLFHGLAKSTILCFSLKKGRSAMTSFLDVRCGYDMDVL